MEIIQEELPIYDDSTVYIADTGDIYHRKECSQMNKERKGRKVPPKRVSLSAVIEVGYSPCTFCNPRKI